MVEPIEWEEQSFSAEDELLRLADDLPVDSPELRNQIISDALTAYRLSWLKLRIQMCVSGVVFCACGVLLSGYYLALWRDSMSPDVIAYKSDHIAPAAMAVEPHSRPMTFSNSEHLTLNPLGSEEWSLVEKSTARRKKSLRHLMSALW